MNRAKFRAIWNEKLLEVEKEIREEKLNIQPELQWNHLDKSPVNRPKSN